jgi:hypothetical protein
MIEGIVTGLVAAAIFVAGIMVGASITQNVTQRDCRDYGHHKVGEWMLDCHKVAP